MAPHPCTAPRTEPRTLTKAHRIGVVLALLLALAFTGGAFGAKKAHAAGCGVLASGAAPQANSAVNYACAQLGTPYSWGGGHGTDPGPSYGICDPSNGAPNDCNVYGFDCSGLVRYVYYQAAGWDIVPGVTTQQWQNPNTVARFYASQGSSGLLPGDLVFFGGSPSTIHHVAIYIGQGQIVEAPYSGGYVQVASLYSHSDYYGAIRLFPGANPPAQAWVDTFANAPVYASPGSGGQTGTLNAGLNYVYCKVWGPIVSDGSSYNHWWLLTDPDIGPARQWVSAYYLSRWGDDEAKDNDGNVIRDC
jgi:cell wall-associated NlpC family hydrolase